MFRNIILITVLIANISLAQVISTTKIQKAEGIGIGSTRSEAVNEAIVEAIGQLTGVTIKKKTIVENLEVEDDQGGKLSLKYNAKINKYTSGKADSYKVLSVTKKNDGLYEAMVLVTNKKVTKKYKTPGLDKKKRRSIAILPPITNSNSYMISEQSFSPSQMSQTFSHELINSLTKTRKFNILDRDNINAYLAEKRVILSNNSSTDELLKLGQVISADYLIVIKISELTSNYDSNKKNIAASFNSGSSYNLNAIIEYRIIAMATRQIKWSSTINKTFSINANNPNDAKLKVSSLITKQITTELLENIYPIKVIKVENDQIFINQGSLKVGTQYNVFSLGKKLYDPYTKEYMGRSENQTGIIEVTRSIAKYSIAKLIEGNIKKSDICRIANNFSKEHLNPKDFGGIEKKDGGGVSLPFD